MRKVVVIGGSAAGMMAAVAAAQENAAAKVSVITTDRVPYRRPAIPALIAGHIKSPEDAKVFSEAVLSRYKIDLECETEVVELDGSNKSLVARSRGQRQQIKFDSAVIATGSSPSIPRIAGADKRGVCTFTTYESAAEIVRLAEGASTAVVVGAGFIALEIAEALMHKGLEVYFNVRSRILRKVLEPELSAFLTSRFEQAGLKMLAGEAISQICGDDNVEYVVHRGKKIPATLVIMGTGVKPNTALAEKSGIELGASGAIRVDMAMQTSAKDIYAAGDCAESPDASTGGFVYLPVGSIGACAGSVAGRNAAGANIETAGFLRAQADQILGFQIFTVGHSSTSAEELNLDVEVHDLKPPKSGGRKNLFEAAKLLTDRKDRIVGAQLIARKHGSQYASQLYRAVVDGESRSHFLERFNSPRGRMATALLRAGTGLIEVEQVGEGKSLKLAGGIGKQE